MVFYLLDGDVAKRHRRCLGNLVLANCGTIPFAAGRPMDGRNSAGAVLSRLGDGTPILRRLPERTLRDAGALNRLVRLLLLNLVAFALTYLLRWLALSQAAIVERCGRYCSRRLSRQEIALRCASYYFGMPLPPLENRRSHAGSLVAGLIRLQPPSLSGNECIH